MLQFPNKKYNIIYADPPWSFATWSLKGKEKKSAENHYDTMNIQDIYNLPIHTICKDDCILFLWVTYPLLLQGIDTIKHWGFTYKTCGYWTRANNEICLLATKGKPKRVSKSVHQIVYEPIDKHSKKPNCVRERIVELCGDLPRIELFARQKHEGWDAWGNEVC